MAKRQKRESQFRKVLTQLMDEKSMSIRDAARIAEVAASTIAGWRTGRNPDNFHAVQRLAKHFGVGMDFLLTGDHADASQSAQTGSFVAAFDEGEPIFSGVAKVLIQPLIPRK